MVCEILFTKDVYLPLLVVNVLCQHKMPTKLFVTLIVFILFVPVTILSITLAVWIYHSGFVNAQQGETAYILASMPQKWYTIELEISNQ